MSKKTRKKYEELLNEKGALLEDLMYLTEPSENRRTIKKSSLRNLLNDGRYGYIMKKYDPVVFEAGYKQWVWSDHS
jgi:hypothetical protein